MAEIKWLPRLLDKITKTTTPNNSEFTYYGHKVTMLSGTTDYTDVTIQDKRGNTILDFSLDFLTKECDICGYTDYNLRDSLVNTLNKLYDGRMRFTDHFLECELNFYEPMLGDDEYDQEHVHKIYNELLTHKIYIN